MPTITRDITITVDIDIEIEPAQKGCCDSMGLPEEPSWDAYVDDYDYGMSDEQEEGSIDEQVKKHVDKYIEEGE